MVDETIVVKLHFLGGYPSSVFSFEANLLIQQQQITSLETREIPESLSHLGLISYRVVTDEHTDRQNSHG